jgi:hypothetical protein
MAITIAYTENLTVPELGRSAGRETPGLEIEL